MAIADIKKFINDKQEEMYYADKGDYFILPNDVGNILAVILNMLDELDERPKAHYIEIDQRIDETEPLEYKCSNCKNTFYFDEVYDYCIKCGSKMENAREILGG